MYCILPRNVTVLPIPHLHCSRLKNQFTRFSNKNNNTKRNLFRSRNVLSTKIHRGKGREEDPRLAFSLGGQVFRRVVIENKSRYRQTFLAGDLARQLPPSRRRSIAESRCSNYICKIRHNFVDTGKLTPFTLYILGTGLMVHIFLHRSSSHFWMNKVFPKFPWI